MTDTLTPLARPRVYTHGDPPEPMALRGLDVRAWDRRTGRRVWGPRYPFQEPSDVVVDNGIIRVRGGSRGTPPTSSCRCSAPGVA